MSVHSEYDAIVIGGGLAGACAAFHLAKSKRRVLILEKENHPHHKVCGEFLSAEAIPYLKDMGLDLESQGAESIHNLNLYSEHRQLTLALPHKSLGITRKLLDEICLEKAQEHGAKVLRGATVLNFEKRGPNYTVHTASHSFQSRALFLATGKQDLRTAQKREGLENTAVGFKTHFTPSVQFYQKIQNSISLFFFPGGYAGLSLVEGGLANFCFILRKDIVKSCQGRFDQVFDHLLYHNPQLQFVCDELQPQTQKPLTIANVPYGFLQKPNASHAFDDGVYCLGDQFCVIPSLAGTGMTIALLTATTAVKNFISHPTTGTQIYKKQCYKHLRKAMLLSYPLHALCQSPRTTHALFTALHVCKPLSKALIRFTRITTSH